MSWLSDYPEEEEILFFETTLAIKNILSNNKSFKSWIDVFYLYDHIIHGGYISILKKAEKNKKKQTKLVKLLTETIDKNETGFTEVGLNLNGRRLLMSRDEDDDYMNNLFEYYCSQNTSLWINFEQLQNECCSDLVKLFMEKGGKFGKWIKYLQSRHGAKVQPLYLFEWNPSKFKIERLFEKRNKLCQITGLPLTCEVIHGEDHEIADISFRPYLLSSNKGKKKITARFGLRLAQMGAPIRNVMVSYNMWIDCINFYTHFAPVFMSMNRDLDGGLKEYGRKQFNQTERRVIKNYNKATTNIKLAIMIPEIQNDLKQKLPISTQNVNDNIYNDLGETSMSYNIKTENSVNNDWIFTVYYLYAFSNSIVFLVDLVSDYYVLYELRTHFNWKDTHDPLLYIWCMMLIDLISCQIMYTYQFASKHFNKSFANIFKICNCCGYNNMIGEGFIFQTRRARRAFIKRWFRFWFGVFLLFLLSPLLPLIEAMPYLYYKWDIIRLFNRMKVPIKKKSINYNVNKIVKLSSETDEVRYWLQNYLRDNTLIFRQIVYESSIQLVLQSISFIILFKREGSINHLVVHIVSIFITLTTMSSKLLVYSYSINSWCILFNFFCWVADITGIYCILIMVAYIIIFDFYEEDTDDLRVWSIFLGIEIGVCLINYIIDIFANNPESLWKSTLLLPFGVTAKVMFKFAYFPKIIFFHIEAGDKTLQYQYYQDILRWINNYDCNEYRYDYHLRLAIANFLICKEYVTKTGKNDDKFIQWILADERSKNNKKPPQRQLSGSLEHIMSESKYRKYNRLLTIKPKDIRQNAQMTFPDFIQLIISNVLGISVGISRVNYDFYKKRYNDWTVLSYYIAPKRHKMIIKISNMIYLFVQTLYILFPLLFMYKPGFTFNPNKFAIFPTIFCVFYCLSLMAIGILGKLKVYNIEKTAYHLVPMRKGFYYQWSSNAVGKMKIIRTYLIENVINKSKNLQKSEYHHQHRHNAYSSNHGGGFVTKFDFREQDEAQTGGSTTMHNKKSNTTHSVFNDDDDDDQDFLRET